MLDAKYLPLCSLPSHVSEYAMPSTPLIGQVQKLLMGTSNCTRDVHWRHAYSLSRKVCFLSM